MSNSLQPQALQHARLPCPSPTPGAYSNSCASSRWCHRTISSSVIPFSSCLQTFPVSVFSNSQFFASSSQSIGVSASASVLPMNIQNWFPLGRAGWISLQSKRLPRVFSNTTVQSINSSVPRGWKEQVRVGTWLRPRGREVGWKWKRHSNRQTLTTATEH